MNKILLYIKQVVLLATGNKLRFVLIFIGTLVGVYIYATGNLVLDSVYYGQTKEFRCMPENSFFVLTEENTRELAQNIVLASTNIPMIERISSSGFVIYEKDYNDTYLIVYARVHGISQPQDNILVYNEKYGTNMSSVRIVSGRRMTATEIKNNELVCMIDENTEKMLFGDKSGIGQYIYFNKYNGGIEAVGGESHEAVAYEIVGIMEDSFYTEKEIEQEQQYISGKEQQYSFVNIICPYDYYKNIGEDESNFINIGYIWEYESKSEMLEDKENVETQINIIGKYFNVSDVVDKEYKYEQAKDELEKYEIAVNVATILLFIIMGVSCMSIIFFAMKERVNEIGIKKAFGATIPDIIFQFWLENLLIILASVIAAIILSFATVMLCEGFIKEILFMDFEVHITGKNIFMPLLLGLLQGMVFTIIPCIRYSIISVTKALKMDK